MTVTDARIIKLMEKYPHEELEERVCQYDLEEGETELELVTSTAEHLLEMLDEPGWDDHEELLEAKRILKDIKNGQNLVIDLATFSLKPRHPEAEVKWAESIIAERGTLRRLVTALHKLK